MPTTATIASPTMSRRSRAGPRRASVTLSRITLRSSGWHESKVFRAFNRSWQMRYPAGHRERTRAKILRAACRVFRRQGYHAAGVDKVMEEAGLTAGGFYAHFASKEALLAEALAPAAAGALRDEPIEHLTGRAWAEAFVERYL